jgi:hypothetical protein
VKDSIITIEIKAELAEEKLSSLVHIDVGIVAAFRRLLNPRGSAEVT